jgi:hypothetical protein
MNDDAKRWVQALRSGKYQQATGVLYDGNGYCCLGVACDVLGIKFLQDGDGDFYADILCEYGALCILPPQVRDMLGLRTRSGGSNVELTGSGRTMLTELNDDGVTFPEIADIIEKYESNLFPEGGGHEDCF